MALEGDLSIFRLPDILQVIAQQQKTGILTVQGEADILAVSFHEGKVVAADALNQSFEEMLGEVLASQGVVSPERFQRFSEEHRTTAGERLADFLIRKGALSREQLLSALRFQTYRLLLEVLRWKQGEFKFYSGEEVAFEEGIEPLAVDEVLYRSMRDLLGEGTVAGAMPHGFVAYEAVIPSRPLRVVRDNVTPIEREADVIWISPDERMLLDRLDGRTPADRIASESGLGDVRTQYALFHLLRAGLVRPTAHIPGETAVRPPESVPVAPGPERVERAERGAETAAPAEKPERPKRAPRAKRSERAQMRVVPRPDTDAGVFVDEETGVETAAAPAGSGLGRAVATVAAIGALAALGLAVFRPAAALLPYPTQKIERAGLERLERQARFAAIDRAAREFYLLEGRYPASLEDLIERGLLASRQRFDSSGRRLVFEPTEDAYSLVPAGGADPAEARVTESVAGDVLLDRTLFASVQTESGVPLVLLD
jgi:hypothetical protein